MLKRDIDLNETDMKTALRIMIAEAGVDSIASVARSLDMKETTLRSSITRETLRVEDLKRIASSMGYTVVIKPTEDR